MKKIYLLLLPILLLTGCKSDEKKEDKPVVPEDPSFVNHEDGESPFRYQKSDGGKARLVNRGGVPFLMQSSLLRTDLLKNADFLTASQMEDYFAIAKETSMNTMDITIMWSEIEKEYNKYDFSELDYYLNYAKKYDLKMNIEWYGSFTDGETHTVNLPDYVVKDQKTYPLILDLFDFANYGHCEIIDWSNANLIHREQLALYNVMNHIYDWNHENSVYDPVMMIQIGQGIDRFQRWRIDAYKVPGKEGLMTSNEAWEMVNNYINEMAKAVKYSKYKALTRVEFCEQNAVVNYVRNIEKLEYVDLVSPTYLHQIGNTKNGIKSFVDEYEDMPIINAENWANDINYKQILINYAMGGDGYVSYQLSAPRYFPESPNGAIYKRYNPEGTTLAEKFVQNGTRADDTKMINSALRKANVAASNAVRSNFGTLGLNTTLDPLSGDERIQKEYLKCGLLISFSNPENCLGFAIYDQNYLYCFCNKDSSITIENCTITIGQKGSFDETGEWNSEQSINLIDNKTLNMEANQVYRVRMASINELPSASQLENDGYKSTLDSIRN